MYGLLQTVKGTLWQSASPPNSRANTEPPASTPAVSKETKSVTGRITRYDKASGSGMIDSYIFFTNEAVIGKARPQVGVEVNVQAEREHSLAGWKATRVIFTTQWTDSDSDHVINKVGYVLEEGKASCLVVCGNDEYVFERDVFQHGSYPRRGDWVTLQLTTEDDCEYVTAVNYLREKTVTAIVENVSGNTGMLEGDIGFTRHVCDVGRTPREGEEVLVYCIETKHNRMAWRALRVSQINNGAGVGKNSPGTQSIMSSSSPHMTSSEVRCGVCVSGEADFGEVECDRTSRLVMTISNGCTNPHTLLSCYPVSFKDQLKVTVINRELENKVEEANDTVNEDPIAAINLNPGASGGKGSVVIQPEAAIDVGLELRSNTLGALVTAVVFYFGDFKISRSVKARIIDPAVYSLQPTLPYTRNSYKTNRYNYADYSDKLRACHVPGQRPRRKRNIRLPHKLKLYPVPDEIRDCMDVEQDITFVRPSLLEPLSMKSYQEVFTTLLCCEELQMEKNIRMFDMYCVSLSVSHQYLSLTVPGLSEGRPSLLVGDKVIICESGADERTEHHEGYVHEVRGCDILLMFSERFHNRFHGSEEYDVMFTFNRIPLRRMYQSIEIASQIGAKVLFPTPPSPLPPILRFPTTSSPVTYFNPMLNERQKAAVHRVLGAQGRPLPYIIFGPPGTGKTVTIVEAILQVYIQSGKSERILACAPSNSASDLIAERLIDSGQVEKGDLVRVNALQRVQPPSPRLLPYCIDTDEVEVAVRHKIVVSTCVTAGVFYSLGLPVGHFSRVFVDEVGQATEPECLIALGLIMGSETQPVLAGDPFQLGPVLQSTATLSHGLGVSLLERLMNRPAYQRNEERFFDHGAYDPLLVTKLVVNYRSHSSLLSLYSKIFYDNELEPAADPALTHSLCEWERLPNPGFPLLFHGIIGEDMREGDSPSWFNPMEVVQVVRYTQLLLNGSLPLSVNDIGIITPYRKQVEKIRQFLKTTGIEDIKVGSVEEFQGQERAAIILSTVRCSSNILQADLKHHLGFLSNPKRFNVSISRAQALLIVIGNPVLLNQDIYWSQLLNYAVENSAYIGTPLHNVTTPTGTTEEEP